MAEGLLIGARVTPKTAPPLKCLTPEWMTSSYSCIGYHILYSSDSQTMRLCTPGTKLHAAAREIQKRVAKIPKEVLMTPHGPLSTGQILMVPWEWSQLLY